MVNTTLKNIIANKNELEKLLNKLDTQLDNEDIEKIKKYLNIYLNYILECEEELTVYYDQIGEVLSMILNPRKLDKSVAEELEKQQIKNVKIVVGGKEIASLNDLNVQSKDTIK